MINNQELTKEQIKRMKYFEKNNIKEYTMNNENRINQINFMKLAKLIRNKIQSSFILYKKNYLNDNYNNKKLKRRTILDEQDPFGFEYQRQINYDRRYFNRRKISDHHFVCLFHLYLLPCAAGCAGSEKEGRIYTAAFHHACDPCACISFYLYQYPY